MHRQQKINLLFTQALVLNEVKYEKNTAEYQNEEKL